MSVKKLSNSTLSTKNTSLSGDLITVEMLLVGGGGGGGSAGGGAGGYNYQSTFIFKKNVTYTVIVGNGGAGMQGAFTASSPNGERGGDTSITSTGFSLYAYGGGWGIGGYFDPKRPGSGASGGGGVSSSATDHLGGEPITGQGNAGGDANISGTALAGAGGGGAGAVGGNSVSATVAGSGGIGLQNSITGTATYYCGGGGGGSSGAGTAGNGGAGGGGGGSSTAGGTGGSNGGQNGTNTVGGNGGTNSGGGGGGMKVSTTGTNAGNGGSGIAVIKYPTGYAAATTTGTVTYSILSGFRIYTFTGSGTIKFN
jgi:hypothetical protein